MSWRKRGGDAGPEPNVPVTPFLDMAFQLLAFFIMTYHPSALEGQMELALPSNQEKAAASPDQVALDAESHKDPDEDLKLPIELTVVIKTQHDGVNDGAISGLSVQDQAGQKPINGSLPEMFKGLEAHLKTVREGLNNKEGIKVQGDSRLKWKEVVKIMDICRDAGFPNVSFSPPADLNIGG